MLTPTKRACIDIGHKCNINCVHCYHKHEFDRDKKPFISLYEIIKQAEAAHYRGCNYIDFTGGEPTLCTYLPEAIKTIGEKFGIKCCVITNAICGTNTIQKFIDAGTDDFLISMHGMSHTFGEFTGVPNARELQIATIEHIPKFRINFCITKQTINDIIPFADWVITYYSDNVKIVNFINFNPHNAWAGNSETAEMLAGLNIAGDMLNHAIAMFEESGIGVNVRYFPMCCIATEHRKNICNDLHVSFDPYEWDYEITPKTVEKHIEWAHGVTINNELKTQPCRHCSLQWVCGGINKSFFEFSQGEYIQPVTDYTGDPHDFDYYRKANVLCF
jgi:pyruvate-formate lyase-activating enzyme